ncbi:unnamed protein product [Rhizoctonia solani]|uniref:Protein argonaute N-terminal domain-containing protein n=1 Tax=Rhizoctonia solani TaxID=456999 RepID=A0A8H3E783_9AGAM|nr:unnamed protein product [Rhizoctonia solani]
MGRKKSNNKKAATTPTITPAINEGPSDAPSPATSPVASSFAKEDPKDASDPVQDVTSSTEETTASGATTPAPLSKGQKKKAAAARKAALAKDNGAPQPETTEEVDSPTTPVDSSEANTTMTKSHSDEPEASKSLDNAPASEPEQDLEGDAWGLNEGDPADHNVTKPAADETPAPGAQDSDSADGVQVATEPKSEEAIPKDTVVSTDDKPIESVPVPPAEETSSDAVPNSSSGAPSPDASDPLETKNDPVIPSTEVAVEGNLPNADTTKPNDGPMELPPRPSDDDNTPLSQFGSRTKPIVDTSFAPDGLVNGARKQTPSLAGENLGSVQSGSPSDITGTGAFSTGPSRTNAPYTSPTSGISARGPTAVGFGSAAPQTPTTTTGLGFGFGSPQKPTRTASGMSGTSWSPSAPSKPAPKSGWGSWLNKARETFEQAVSDEPSPTTASGSVPRTQSTRAPSVERPVQSPSVGPSNSNLDATPASPSRPTKGMTTFQMKMASLGQKAATGPNKEEKPAPTPETPKPSSSVIPPSDLGASPISPLQPTQSYTQSHPSPLPLPPSISDLTEPTAPQTPDSAMVTSAFPPLPRESTAETGKVGKLVAQFDYPETPISSKTATTGLRLHTQPAVPDGRRSASPVTKRDSIGSGIERPSLADMRSSSAPTPKTPITSASPKTPGTFGGFGPGLGTNRLGGGRLFGGGGFPGFRQNHAPSPISTPAAEKNEIKLGNQSDLDDLSSVVEGSEPQDLDSQIGESEPQDLDSLVDESGADALASLPINIDIDSPAIPTTFNTTIPDVPPSYANPWDSPRAITNEYIPTTTLEVAPPLPSPTKSEFGHEAAIADDKTIADPADFADVFPEPAPAPKDEPQPESPVASEHAVTPVTEKPAQVPAPEEPVVAPVVEEPAVSPVVEELAVSPAVDEPVVAPVPHDEVPKPELSEPIAVCEPPVVEPPPEISSEEVPEPPVEPVVEAAIEPAVESTVEPAVKPAVEAIVEAIVEPTVEPVVEPIVGPTIEPTVESTIEVAVEPSGEPSSEPSSKPSSEPSSEPAVEPIIEATVEPAAEATGEPTTVELIAIPIVESVVEAVEAVTESTLEPTPEVTPEAIPESAPEPAAETVVEPAVEVPAEPTPEPVVTPLVEPVSEPVAESATVASTLEPSTEASSLPLPLSPIEPPVVESAPVVPPTAPIELVEAPTEKPAPPKLTLEVPQADESSKPKSPLPPTPATPATPATSTKKKRNNKGKKGRAATSEPAPVIPETISEPAPESEPVSRSEPISISEPAPRSARKRASAKAKVEPIRDEARAESVTPTPIEPPKASFEPAPRSARKRASAKAKVEHIRDEARAESVEPILESTPVAEVLPAPEAPKEPEPAPEVVEEQPKEDPVKSKKSKPKKNRKSSTAPTRVTSPIDDVPSTPVEKAEQPVAEVIEVAEPVVEVVEPVAVEPAVVEPVPVQPVVTEPVVTEPVVVEPAVEVAEPVVEDVKPSIEVAEPVVAEPVVETAVVEPMATEPVVAELVVEVAEPVVEEVEPSIEVAEPAVAEPVVIESAVVELVMAEPTMVEPAVVEPISAEPILVEPTPAESAMVEPIIVEVPVEVVAMPPVAEDTTKSEGNRTAVPDEGFETPKVAPQELPELVSEPVEVAPQTPEIEVFAEAVVPPIEAESSPEPIPVSPPTEVHLEVTPEVILETIPEATPETIPGSTPEVASEIISVPEPQPKLAPEWEPEPVVVPIFEPTADPVVEAVTEPLADVVAEIPVELTHVPVPELVSVPTVEPIAEPTFAPLAEDIVIEAQPVFEPVPEPQVQLPTEAVFELVASPIVEAPKEQTPALEAKEADSSPSKSSKKNRKKKGVAKATEEPASSSADGLVVEAVKPEVPIVIASVVEDKTSEEISVILGPVTPKKKKGKKSKASSVVPTPVEEKAPPLPLPVEAPAALVDTPQIEEMEEGLVTVAPSADPVEPPVETEATPKIEVIELPDDQDTEAASTISVVQMYPDVATTNQPTLPAFEDEVPVELVSEVLPEPEPMPVLVDLPQSPVTSALSVSSPRLDVSSPRPEATFLATREASPPPRSVTPNTDKHDEIRKIPQIFINPAFSPARPVLEHAVSAEVTVPLSASPISDSLSQSSQDIGSFGREASLVPRESQSLRPTGSASSITSIDTDSPSTVDKTKMRPSMPALISIPVPSPVATSSPYHDSVIHHPSVRSESERKHSAKTSGAPTPSIATNDLPTNDVAPKPDTTAKPSSSRILDGFSPLRWFGFGGLPTPSAENKPVEVNPMEVTPVEVKLVEARPVEVRPVEVEPVVVNPIDVNPAEITPVEKKPFETKDAEIKAAETKPVEVKPVEITPVEAHSVAAPSPNPKIVDDQEKQARVTLVPIRKAASPPSPESPVVEKTVWSRWPYQSAMVTSIPPVKPRVPLARDAIPAPTRADGQATSRLGRVPPVSTMPPIIPIAPIPAVSPSTPARTNASYSRRPHRTNGVASPAQDAPTNEEKRERPVKRSSPRVTSPVLNPPAPFQSPRSSDDSLPAYTSQAPSVDHDPKPVPRGILKRITPPATPPEVETPTTANPARTIPQAPKLEFTGSHNAPAYDWDHAPSVRKDVSNSTSATRPLEVQPTPSAAPLSRSRTTGDPNHRSRSKHSSKELGLSPSKINYPRASSPLRETRSAPKTTVTPPKPNLVPILNEKVIRPKVSKPAKISTTRTTGDVYTQPLTSPILLTSENYGARLHENSVYQYDGISPSESLSPTTRRAIFDALQKQVAPQVFPVLARPSFDGKKMLYAQRRLKVSSKQEFSVELPEQGQESQVYTVQLKRLAVITPQ